MAEVERSDSTALGPQADFDIDSMTNILPINFAIENGMDPIRRMCVIMYQNSNGIGDLIFTISIGML